MRTSISATLAVIFLTLGSAAWADTAWSTHDYDLHPGDFNGDGLTDMLYVARDPAHLSGIALSDGSGFNTPLQCWGNAYLGIPWSDGLYTILVADFNGDGEDDLFLQRNTPGDHYLLLTEEGGVGAISQTLPNDAAGLDWSAHHLVAGDFNGDGHADLFLQAGDANGLNAVIAADVDGQFTAIAPDQSWDDGYAGFDWATSEALVFAGDYNGDGQDDLLLQARPIPGTGTDALNPAVYPPHLNGVVLAQPAKAIFATEAVQSWSRDGFKAEWSPLISALGVGDFNGDGRADVLLQGQGAGDASYLLYGKAKGAIFEPAQSLEAGELPPAESYRLLPGAYSGQAASLYAQAQTEFGQSYFASFDKSVVAVSAPATLLEATASNRDETSPSSSAEQQTSSPSSTAALSVLPLTAGRTPTEFSIANAGTANYGIPIWTPPSIGKLKLDLALEYSSRGPNGTLGVGWSLSGLSAITRCIKTWVQDGNPGPVTLQRSTSYSDRFCLNGIQLKLTSAAGTYGYPNSTYATEIESFALIKAGASSVGNGPASFTITTKRGFIYKYGTTTDSQIPAGSSGTIRAWALSEISDRVGNKISFVYQNDAANGTYRIDRISYPTTATGQGPFYQVQFGYEARPATDVLSGYIAGFTSREPNRLSSITVQNVGGAVIKQYNLAYVSAPVTQRSLLTTVQECSPANCLPVTTIGYQAGASGVSSTPSITVPLATSDNICNNNGGPFFGDFNGDGLTDLLYCLANSGASQQRWYAAISNGSTFGTPIDLGVVTNDQAEIMRIGRFLGNGRDQIIFATLSQPPTAYWYWNGSTMAQGVVGGSYTTAGRVNVMDVDGDGLDDIVTAGFPVGNILYVARNNTLPGGALAFAARVAVYTAPSGTKIQNLAYRTASGSGLTAADFDGDGRADMMVGIYVPGMPGQQYWLPARSNGSVGGTVQPLSIGQQISWDTLSGTYYASSFSSMLDWDGDGCTDFVQPNTLRISRCDGTFVTFSLPTAAAGKRHSAGDWNADGRHDVTYSETNGAQHVLLSNGANPAMATDVIMSSSGNPPAMGTAGVDPDGDGQADAYYPNPTRGTASGGWLTKIYLHNSPNVLSDFASSFTDGYGMVQSPSYVPITDSTVYSRNTDAVFPEYDYTGPLYVVSRFTASDGTGSTYQNQFFYYGARMHVQGRGFEGFFAQRRYDSRDGVYRYQYLGQTFPYTNVPYQSIVTAPNSTSQYTSRSNGTLASTTLVGSGYEARYFPYVSPVTVQRWELNGAKTNQLVSTAATTTTYGDGYGNPTQIVVAVTDDDSTAPASPFVGLTWTTTVANTYSNDASANWCIGVPTSTAVQSAIPGQPVQTRSYAYTVDGSRCRTTQEMNEPVTTALTTTTTYGFDSCGNVDSVSVVGHNPDGSVMPARTTAYNYAYSTSRCQFPERITNGLGHSTTQSYNYSFGVPASSTDPNGAQTSWTQDDFGRNTQVTRPDGTRTIITRDACTSPPCWGVADLRVRITASEYAVGGTAEYTKSQEFFDGFERSRFQESNHVLGTWVYDTVIAYDALGRPIRRDQPYSTASNGYTTWAYDALNRVTTRRVYQSNGTLDRTTAWSYLGQTIDVTDPQSNTTRRVSDIAGRLRRVVDPTPGGTTSYDYDAFGNLNRTVDAIGAVSSATFNLRGSRTQMVDPDAGTWTFDGNSLNETVGWKDAKNQLFSATYDALGRILTRTEPEGTSTWTWGNSGAQHNIGSLHSVSGYGYSETLGYDGIGRPSNRTITTDQSYAFDYTYNTFGLRDTVSYPVSPAPSGTTGTRFKIRYGYSNGVLSAITDITNSSPQPIIWSLTSANDYGSPLSQVVGSGAFSATATRTYKPWTNELLSTQSGISGSTTNRQNLAFGWDVVGNLTLRQDVARSLTEVFTQDSLNRISSSTLNGVPNFSVTYDASGNILTRSDIGNYTYGNSAHPHAVTAAGSGAAQLSYTYDANGNVATRNGLTFTWASYNVPMSLSALSGGQTLTSTFAYSPDRERYKQVGTYANGSETTWYVGGLVEKMNGASGPTYWRHFVPLPSGLSIVVSRNSDGTTSARYLLTDHLGSSDAVIDQASGTLIVQESFGPFGARRGSNWTGTPTSVEWQAIGATSRHGFTGHEHLDNIGLIHMNGRVYDPASGRFASVDPAPVGPGNSQALNPYSYAENRPLVLTDPTGLSPRQCGKDGCTTPMLPWIGAFYGMSYVTYYSEVDASEIPMGLVRVSAADAGDSVLKQGSAEGSVSQAAPANEQNVAPQSPASVRVAPPATQDATSETPADVVVVTASKILASVRIATIDIKSWWIASSTMETCSILCAKVTGRTSSNTQTNGQRVENVVLGLGSSIPGASLEEGAALAAEQVVTVIVRGVAARATGPILKTTKEAARLAESLGFKKVNERIGGEAVFRRGGDFITRDRTGHNGGVWKMADSIENLAKKETRSGTYDASLNRIGD